MCSQICVCGQQPVSTPTPSPTDLPSGPLLRPAPDLSKWTTNFEYPKVADSDNSELKGTAPAQVTVTKTGSTVSEEIVDVAGRQESIWHVGETQYRRPAGKSDWYESSASVGGNMVNSDFSPLPANGFRGWEWVDKESYTGVSVSEFGTCLIFIPGGYERLKASGRPLTKEQLALLPTVAFVNLDTRLPVALRANGVTQRIVFAQPPTGMQKIPVDLSDAIKKGEEARKRLFQPAPRPY